MLVSSWSLSHLTLSANFMRVGLMRLAWLLFEFYLRLLFEFYLRLVSWEGARREAEGLSV